MLFGKSIKFVLSVTSCVFPGLHPFCPREAGTWSASCSSLSPDIASFTPHTPLHVTDREAAAAVHLSEDVLLECVTKQGHITA